MHAVKLYVTANLYHLLKQNAPHNWFLFDFL